MLKRTKFTLPVARRKPVTRRRMLAGLAAGTAVMAAPRVSRGLMRGSVLVASNPQDVPVTTAPYPGSSPGNLNALTALAKAQPNQTWFRLPANTVAHSVWADQTPGLLNPPGYAGLAGVEGTSAVWNDWDGAAFDEAGKAMYIFGGGHSGYGGNEVYRLRFDTLNVERLTDPGRSTFPPPATDPETGRPWGCKTQGPFVSGDGPMPWHTYGGITWCPQTQSFFSPQFGGFCSSGGWPDHRELWEFVPARAGKHTGWRRRASFPPNCCGLGPSYFGYYMCEWVPTLARMFMFNNSLLGYYNPATDTWSNWNTGPAWNGEGSTCFDPHLNRVWILGRGNYFGYLDTSGFGPDGSQPKSSVLVAHGTSAPSELVWDCGQAYDPKSKFIAFHGGKSPQIVFYDTIGGHWYQLPNAGQSYPAQVNTVNNKLRIFAGLRLLVTWYNGNDAAWAYKLGELSNAIRIT